MNLIRTRSLILLTAILAQAAACMYCMAQGGITIVTFYVAVDGSDSWSGRLPEPDALKNDGPFRTIERAQRMIATARTANGRVSYQYQVLLRGGYYELSKPLQFGPNDSGAPNAPVIYASFPGEVARISGGNRIRGWTQIGDGLWSAPYLPNAPNQHEPSEFFSNSVRRQRPRLPFEGFFQVKDIPVTVPGAPNQGDRFLAQPSDLPSESIVNAEVVMIHDWKASRVRIASYSRQSGLVELAGSTVGDDLARRPTAGVPYYIDNVGENPRYPGVWKFDENAHRIVYFPTSREDMSKEAATVPYLDQLVIIRGTTEREVHDISFQGIVFEYTDWQLPTNGRIARQAEIGLPSAIEIEAAHSITLSNFGVRHTGGNAIRVGNGSRDIRIEGGEITDIGGTGISIGLEARGPASGGKWTPRITAEDRVGHVLIDNNLIASVGRIHLGSVGVWVGQADHVAIERNEIRDLYYSGISLGWTWGYGESMSHDNRVVGNLVHDFGQGILSDFGGIYTLGTSVRTLVASNIIYDGNARIYGGNGIYADAGTTGVTFSNNNVSRVSDAGIHLNYGRDVVFTGNIVAYFGEAGVRCSHGNSESSAIFDGNIFYSVSPPILLGRCADRAFEFSKNVFWALSGAPELQEGGLKRSRTGFLAKAYGDRNFIADPRFVGPESNDFRLRGDSSLRSTFRDGHLNAGRISESVIIREMLDDTANMQ